MKPKRLLLLKEVLEDLQYPDRKFGGRACSRFSISGWLTESNVFPRDFKRPEYDMETVKAMSAGLNRVILSQVCDPADAALAEAAWNSTQGGDPEAVGVGRL